MTSTPAFGATGAGGGAPGVPERDTDPHRWGMLALLAVAELAGMSLWFAGNAVAPALAERWALSAGQIGTLTTAVQLGFVAGTATVAMLNLADIVAGRVLFATAAVLGAICNAALAGAGSYEVALVTRFGVGFFLAGVYPPAMKMAATWFRARRGLAVGTVVGALTIGKATPYLVQSVAGADVNAVVMIASAAGVFAALVIALGYRDGPYPFPKRPFSWRLVGDVVRHREYRLATGGYLGHMAELYSYWTWIPAFIVAAGAAHAAGGGPGVRAPSTGEVALLSFGVIAIGGLGCIWGGIAGDRLGRERLVIIAMAASGACALLVGFTFGLSWWVLAPVALAWGFFVVADSAQFSVLVTESVPAHAVGTALTLQVSLGFLLTTLTIQLVPPIVAVAGWQWAFPALAAGPIIGIWCIRRLVALKRAARAAAASAVAVLAVMAGLAGASSTLGAQQARDSLAIVHVNVQHDARPVFGATVRGGPAHAFTSGEGRATLRLPAGTHALVVMRLGFRPETVSVNATLALAATVDVTLERLAGELETVVVASTRSQRISSDDPTRVDVLVREEIEEKMLMTPGDIAMMLNETGGLRVQTTSPSLGGAHVRIHGLSGRYTLLLSDGLPLYGGQAGGLGLLQIPPMDLGHVEVIKGAASALYGAAALGGVINLIARRPGDEAERELLLNQTTRGGTDVTGWLSGPLSEGWSYSLLAGAHRQRRNDLDADGWTDMPGYERFVARPRAYWDNQRGGTVLFTAGVTRETRRGGTLAGRTAPDGAPFAESLETRRLDAGAIGTFILGASRVLSVRGSAMSQRHEHAFGATSERDRHRTWFGEAALTSQYAWGSSVVGAAVEGDAYTARDVAGFDYDFTTPSVFAQLDVNATDALALVGSVRLDRHGAVGSLVHPRVSARLRGANDWTARLSLASGAFAPTPFTEETEVTGLSPVDPLVGVRAERAVTASFDVSGPIAALETGATLFASNVRRALALAEEPNGRLSLFNAAEPTRVAGAEVFARWKREPFVVTGSYTFVDATESAGSGGSRRDVPLTPRHAAGAVAMWEEEGRGRAGLELYYTGRQALDDNPYRADSRPYVILGALVEWHVGPVRLFLNAENLTGVRQSNYHPLVRATPGRGGRWTTDAWTELSGRTVNGGVRIGG